MITATRYHDFSAGHRVYGHESKCRYLHGHNYRVYFTCAGLLDAQGRVIDFSVMKEKLCNWVEEKWDHKLLMWEQDPLTSFMLGTATINNKVQHLNDIFDSIVEVPFNPTAENMAKFLLNVMGPRQLEGTGVKLVSVKIDETRKCSATASR